MEGAIVLALIITSITPICLLVKSLKHMIDDCSNFKDNDKCDILNDINNTSPDYIKFINNQGEEDDNEEEDDDDDNEDDDEEEDEDEDDNEEEEDEDEEDDDEEDDKDNENDEEKDEEDCKIKNNENGMMSLIDELKKDLDKKVTVSTSLNESTIQSLSKIETDIENLFIELAKKKNINENNIIPLTESLIDFMDKDTKNQSPQSNDLIMNFLKDKYNPQLENIYANIHKEFESILKK